MPPLVVLYHVRISGAGIDPGHAQGVFRSQIDCLAQGGLGMECDQFVISCNQTDSVFVRAQAPDKATIIIHPDTDRSELPTLAYLQDWLPSHPGHYVFYHHTKCATRADPLCYEWRGCMTRKLVLGWHMAVHLLNLGHEAVGCHWLTPERWPGLVKSPYFGGNFFWAKTDFLSELPRLPSKATCRQDFYLAESWIGTGRRPSVFDFHPDWPSYPGCAAS